MQALRRPAQLSQEWRLASLTLRRAGQQRFNSSLASPTSAAKGKQPSRWSGYALSFVLGSLGTIGFSYYIYRSRVSGKDKTFKFKYGSAPEFQQAVRMLCLTFPEEGRVTTEPEDLYDHGFSVNDYHPGECDILTACSCTDTLLKALCTASLSTQHAQRMLSRLSRLLRSTECQ